MTETLHRVFMDSVTVLNRVVIPAEHELAMAVRECLNKALAAS